MIVLLCFQMLVFEVPYEISKHGNPRTVSGNEGIKLIDISHLQSMILKIGNFAVPRSPRSAETE